MDPVFIVVGGELDEDLAQVCLPNTIRWSTHSRRIVPISRSAKRFCHGEPTEIGVGDSASRSSRTRFLAHTASRSDQIRSACSSVSFSCRAISVHSNENLLGRRSNHSTTRY